MFFAFLLLSFLYLFISSCNKTGFLTSPDSSKYLLLYISVTISYITLEDCSSSFSLIFSPVYWFLIYDKAFSLFSKLLCCLSLLKYFLATLTSSLELIENLRLISQEEKTSER